MKEETMKFRYFPIVAVLALAVGLFASVKPAIAQGGDDQERYYSETHPGWNANQSNRDRDQNRGLFRDRDSQVAGIVQRLQTDTDSFHNMVRMSWSNRWWGMSRNDRFGMRVSSFDAAVTQFRRDYDRSRDVSVLRGDLRVVMNRANGVDGLLGRMRASSGINNSWDGIRSDINRLADFYDLRSLQAQNFNPMDNEPYPYGSDRGLYGWVY
jgi:hypothetical protein